jgi:hypothetical protein
MKRNSAFRANTGLLGAVFLIALTGLLPAGVLYWLMRPTVIVNPGLSAYQAPRPDPLFARSSNYAQNSHVSPFGAARQQSPDGRSAFAAVRKAIPAETSADIGNKKRQVKPRAYALRSTSPLASETTTPVSSWPVGTYGSPNWYR